MAQTAAHLNKPSMMLVTVSVGLVSLTLSQYSHLLGFGRSQTARLWRQLDRRKVNPSETPTPFQ